MPVTVKIQGGDLKGLKKYLEGYLKDPNPGVIVGALSGATYSEGPLAGEPVAQNLARHEFGTATIPARAPLRSTLAKKKKEWTGDVADYLRAYKGDLRAALTEAGEVMAADIQQSFEEGLEPPLKPATVERKKRITREGGVSGKYKTGKRKGEYKQGDYAAHADKPVMLTGQSQKAIQAEYVDNLTAIGGGGKR